MRRKRVFCAVLALLLALTCAVPACADEPDAEPVPTQADVVEAEQPEPSEAPEETPEEAPEETPEETPEESTCEISEETPEDPPEEPSEEPPEATPEETYRADSSGAVDVTVPAAGSVIINPYGLPVETAAGTSAEQIVSEEMPIVNNGETPVTVWVSAAGSVAEPSRAEFVSDPAQLDTGVKGIFMYAEFKREDGDWRGGYCSEPNQVLIGTQASDVQEVLTLDGGSAGLFRLFGSTSVTPDEPWAAEDEIHVNFTFTFKTPQEESDASPAEEEEPPAEEEPSDGEEPPAEEEPAQEPEPPAEEEPAQEPEPPAEGEPAQEPEPPAEEEPTQEPEPPAEGEPAQEPEPPAEEEPAQKPEPPAEEEPAQEPEPPAAEEPAQGPEPPAAEEPAVGEAPPESAEAPAAPEQPDESGCGETVSL